MTSGPGTGAASTESSIPAPVAPGRDVRARTFRVNSKAQLGLATDPGGRTVSRVGIAAGRPAPALAPDHDVGNSSMGVDRADQLTGAVFSYGSLMGFLQGVSCLFLIVALGACAHRTSTPDAAKALVGDWASPVAHGRFMRFSADGKLALALNAADLGTARTTGTWSLAKNTLTFTNLTGACSTTSTEQVGVYTAAFVQGSLRFSKLEDACETRTSIDGETWTRLPVGGASSAKGP